MKHTKYIKRVMPVMISLVLLSPVSFSQNPAPAPPQAKRILFMGAVAHTGTGEVIQNSAVGFENGKIKLLADATTIRIDRNAYDTIINIDGKHIYPGLIALNSVIGLNEIEAVRATRDFDETGTMNPSVRSLIAYNTDSKVTPTIRSNGILMAQVVPTGGLISGQSSVMQLDAWNYEDAAVKADEGMHINWPSMRIRKTNDKEDETRQTERMDGELTVLHSLFEDARAYAMNDKHETININLEAMRGLFNGSKTLYVHCNYVKEIIAAVGFCKEMEVKMALVGGGDSWMVTDLLKAHRVPVIITDVNRLPSREDEDIDLPFRLPAILHNAGVTFAIASHGFWEFRNLPFQAGTAHGYGIGKEQLLKAITLTPAEILGVAGHTGSLAQGKDATFLVTSGDLLDIKSSGVEQAFINGREVSLDNVQKQLYLKYMNKYGLSRP